MIRRRHFFLVFGVGFISGVLYLVGCGKGNASVAGNSRSVLANGETVGEFISFTESLSTGSVKTFVARTSTGYLIAVRRNGNVDFATLYYTSTDCTGTSYAEYAVTKMVFRHGSSLYYVPAGAPEVTTNLQTYRSSQSEDCTSMVPNTLPMISAIPNDPNVTGVSSTSFTAPITIE